MKKKPNADAYLLLSNTFIIACASIVLAVAFYIHQRDIGLATLDDNRFITTEWHLLQELKAQTDQLLRDKDSEIARLRANYHDSLSQDLSPSVLHEIETELKRAEEERAAILASRLSARPPTFVPATAGTHATESENPTHVAPTPLSVLIAESAAESLATEPQSSQSAVRSDSASATGERASSAEAFQKLTRLLNRKVGEIDAEPPPKIESIRTRSLLRALVSSPSIRAEYPELLDALDRSFEDYGRQEWLKGQKAAYVFTIETIKDLRE